MTTVVWLHVLGGAVGLATGFAALSAAKGAPLHRAAGRGFVYAMLVMGLSGALIAALTGVESSVAMGAFAAYLVFTGFTTVAPPRAGARSIGIAGAVVAFALALALGAMAVFRGSGEDGLPAPMALLFAGVALCAAVSDVRVARTGPLRGGRRLTRHLWRMCLALFIASASFFLGQTQVLPVQLQSGWLLATPVLAPILAMGWWLFRLRRRQRAGRAEWLARPDPA